MQCGGQSANHVKSQDSAQSGSTGLSGGAPDSVRCARLARANWPLSGNRRRRSAIIHRTVRCAPDCPVSQRSAGQRSAARCVRDTWPSQRLEAGTGLSGVHRTCPVRQRLLAALGLYKGPPLGDYQEEHTKHSLSTLDHSHSIPAHLFDILVI
jgi:hypothetical protein